MFHLFFSALCILAGLTLFILAIFIPNREIARLYTICDTENGRTEGDIHHAMMNLLFLVIPFIITIVIHHVLAFIIHIKPCEQPWCESKTCCRKFACCAKGNKEDENDENNEREEIIESKERANIRKAREKVALFEAKERKQKELDDSLNHILGAKETWQGERNFHICCGCFLSIVWIGLTIAFFVIEGDITDCNLSDSTHYSTSQKAVSARYNQILEAIPRIMLAFSLLTMGTTGCNVWCTK